MWDHVARLGAIRYERGFQIDGLLLAICQALRLRGLQIGGVIQSSVSDGGHCATSVLVTDLRSGRAYDIWQDRGACARGCRLDEGSLLDAEPVIRDAIADKVDLLVINRFGRAESLGRGLIGSFAAAIEAGIPVLTAVRPPYDAAWMDFHGGLGCAFAPELERVIAWASFIADGSLRLPSAA